MKYSSVSFDIETFGTKPGSIITSIGATAFNLGQPITEDNPTFHIHIDAEDSERMGLTKDASTMAWWEKQSDEAKAALAAGQETACTVMHAINQLDEWMAKHTFKKMVMVWGNGSGFDITLIEELYRCFEGRLPPWMFWNCRDMRTMCLLRPDTRDSIPFEGVKHEALADSYHQAQVINAIYMDIMGLANDQV